MAAEITTRDNGFAEIAYTGATPWHGLGTKVDGTMTSTEAIIRAGLDWEVNLRTMYVGYSGALVPDHFATERTDNGKILGVVGNQYKPVQNHEAFTFLDDIVGERLAMYQVAGSLRGGKRVWLLAKLPEQIVVADRDPLDEYLLLCNSHDGTLAVTVMFTPVRVVCANTEAIALRGKGKRFSTSHKINVHSRLSQARQTLGLAQDYFRQFQAQANMLAKISITKVKSLDVLGYAYKISPAELTEMLLAEKQPADASAIQMMVDMGNWGTGNVEFGGTAWGLFNGVTEYFDHFTPVRGNGESRLWQSTFGRGSQIKQRVWDALVTVAGN